MVRLFNCPATLALASILITTAFAAHGVDLAQRYTLDEMQCLAQNGYSFAVVRAFHSYGAVDMNAPLMIERARAAGISDVEAYLFPCTTFDSSNNASVQVNATVEYLRAHNTRVSRIWFDLEWNPTTSCAWSKTDIAYNCRFLEALRAAVQPFQGDIEWGVYTPPTLYPKLFENCTALSDFLLWYPVWDNAHSFADFVPFGGWTTPAMKQYAATIPVCNISGLMDADWKP